MDAYNFKVNFPYDGRELTAYVKDGLAPALVQPVTVMDEGIRLNRFLDEVVVEDSVTGERVGHISVELRDAVLRALESDLKLVVFPSYDEAVNGLVVEEDVDAGAV